MHLSIWQEMGHPIQLISETRRTILYFTKKQGLRKNTLPVNVTHSSEVLRLMLDEIVQCQMLQNLPNIFAKN